MKRKETKREEIGIYEDLMDDVQDLANIFIGNESLNDYTEGGDFQPFLRLIAELHFSPENTRLYTEAIHQIKIIEKKVLDLRAHVVANYKKGKFIYRNQ